MVDCITSKGIGWEDRMRSLCLGLVSTYHKVSRAGPKTKSNSIAMVVVRMICKVWLAWQCCVDMDVYWHWSCGHARVLKMVKYMIIDWVIQCQMDNGHWNHPKMSSRRRGTFRISPKKGARHHWDFKIISVQIDEKKYGYLIKRLKCYTAQLTKLFWQTKVGGFIWWTHGVPYNSPLIIWSRPQQHVK